MTKINLYHYSNQNFSGYIRPEFFGYNSFTNNSQKISGVKRIFFYTDKDRKEFFFNGCRYLYLAKIEKNKLYNLDIDILKVLTNKRIKDIYIYIKKLGYKGILSGNIAVLYSKIKITQKRG